MFGSHERGRNGTEVRKGGFRYELGSAIGTDIEGVVWVMLGTPEQKKGEDGLPIPPYAVYNIGGGQPENLLDFVNILQEELLRAGVLPADFDFEAHKKLVPMQPGDVPTTYADASALERDFGFTPKITLREGLRKFAEWYKSYYCSDVCWKM